ncbi:MAG: ABC transporter permease [Myxococcales bacterium]|nr:ABC transporter permease [Myxococcales bacterium]
MSVFLDQLRDVLQALRQHKARSLLTLLGMIIGAGSVVLLSGLLQGGQEALDRTNQFIDESDVIEVETADAPPSQRGRTQRPLDSGDQKLIDDAPVTTSGAEGELFLWSKYAYRGAERKRVMVLGASTQAMELYRVRLEVGRFLDDDDQLRRTRSAVIGYEIWQELFGGRKDLTGASLRIAGVRWEVVGVLAHKAPLVAGPGTWMWDRRVVVPATTFQAVLRHSRRVDSIYIRVLPTLNELTTQMERARAFIRSAILQRHYGVENFRVDQDKGQKQQAEIIFTVINVLMLCTAALSLFVGGINIMNIMLVTVTERTREIGIRRALGATRNNILGQFLLEAALLSGIGGLTGVLAGSGLLFVASKALTSWLGSWTAYYPTWAIVAGLSSSTLTGLVFGLYPAWRAARMDPVVALRYE